MKFNDKYKKSIDLYGIYDLIELGLEDEEIAKDFEVSPEYVRKLKNEIKKFDDDI